MDGNYLSFHEGESLFAELAHSLPRWQNPSVRRADQRSPPSARSKADRCLEVFAGEIKHSFSSTDARLFWSVSELWFALQTTTNYCHFSLKVSTISAHVSP
jgi:hypothetical protein